LTKLLNGRIIYSMKIYKNKPWHDGERKILQENYLSVSVEELTILLPGRTTNSIYKQVGSMRKRGWKFKAK